jgi:DNA polymerase family A
MQALRRFYREVWAVDFEFHCPAGERPVPLCLAARELWSQRLVVRWLEGHDAGACPWSLGPDTLFVSYYASAELHCLAALEWPFPLRVLDLCAEFKCLTSGLHLEHGRTLLGALAFYGLPGIASSTKEDMHRLAIRGGPFTEAERRELQAYCVTDVLALEHLLPAMLPQIPLPLALIRGRYMAAVARMERTGTPCDVEMFAQLRTHWPTIRQRLAREVNKTHPVFTPTGTSLDPTTRLGGTVYALAAQHGLDPYYLAVTVEHVWRDTLALYQETLWARRTARLRTGLTAAHIARWENAGRDASSWPGLDALAAALAEELPELGLTAADDVTAALWAMLREDDRTPQRLDPAILHQALTVAIDDPEGLSWEGALSFSTQRFEEYLRAKGLAWPRLPSGQLALDEDTFKEMARAYPVEIGPIREVRSTLAQLTLRDLAIGHDGRNRCNLWAFSSRSSRNQPSNSHFIFGPSAWLRSLIKPGRGRALAYCDWSQQELAIAAYLSGDTAMQAAYRSGDFYLAFAIQAGVAPPHATKQTHAAVRDRFKIVSLGVMFGLSESGIARKLDIPLPEAQRLLQHHKEVFHQFWAWSDQVEIQGMLGGSLHTVFGWRMYAGDNPRSLRNFPMQANGAEMLRLACCLCTERGIDVCAPVHDALVVEADVDRIEVVVAQTQAAMEEASLLVLPGFPLRTEATIVRYPDRYHDPRGSQIWESVQRLLDEITAEVPF